MRKVTLGLIAVIAISGLTAVNFAGANTGSATNDSLESQITTLQDIFVDIQARVQDFLSSRMEKDAFLEPDNLSKINPPGSQSIEVKELGDGTVEIFARSAVITEVMSSNAFRVRIFGLNGRADIISDSKLLSSNWRNISASNFSVGDLVNIWGTQDRNDPTRVQVKTIRNISRLTDGQTACIQVITRARNPQSGQCIEFPTPCDVPSGWQTGCTL